MLFSLFHSPTPTEIYTLSLHDALPILPSSSNVRMPARLAAFFTACSAARVAICSRTSSLTWRISWIASRPFTPELPHFSHPFPTTHCPSDGSRWAPPSFSTTSALGGCGIAHEG